MLEIAGGASHPQIPSRARHPAQPATATCHPNLPPQRATLTCHFNLPPASISPFCEGASAGRLHEALTNRLTHPVKSLVFKEGLGRLLGITTCLVNESLIFDKSLDRPLEVAVVTKHEGLIELAIGEAHLSEVIQQ